MNYSLVTLSQLSHAYNREISRFSGTFLQVWRLESVTAQRLIANPLSTKIISLALPTADLTQMTSVTNMMGKLMR
jgi:hypothetical protein